MQMMGTAGVKEAFGAFCSHLGESEEMGQLGLLFGKIDAITRHDLFKSR